MKKFKPYSDNVIFYDSEFSTSNPYKGEILSVGLVRLDGEGLYIELEYDGEVSDWVRESILPDLRQEKLSREKARKEIGDFAGDSKPHMVAHFSPYDFVFLNNLFETSKPEETPFDWVPIDMMSIFFGIGMDPKKMIPKNETNPFYEEIGVDISKFTIHNALDDARLLREVYVKLAENLD